MTDHLYFDYKCLQADGIEYDLARMYWPWHYSISLAIDTTIIFGCDFVNSKTKMLAFRMLVGIEPTTDKPAVWFQRYNDNGYLVHEPPKGFPAMTDYKANIHIALKVLRQKAFHKTLAKAVKEATKTFDRVEKYFKRVDKIKWVSYKRDDMLNNLVFFYQLCDKAGLNIDLLQRFKYTLKNMYTIFKSKIGLNEAMTSITYYDAYMSSHPEDKMEKLIESLIKEFALDCKKHKFDFNRFIIDNHLDYDLLESALDKLNFHYYWYKIKAQTYAAIISRSTASLSNTKGQRYNENEIQFDDVRRGVSRKVLEECLDIICHNTNVLEANGIIRNSLTNNNWVNKYSKHTKVNIDFRTLINKYLSINASDDIKRELVFMVYAAWASYGKGRFEKFVCDSDNGPEALKEVLNSCSYDADDIDLITTINRAVDTVHTRSDLANAFIEGGAQTCAMVSNLPNKFVL